jgi:hypothetical protein
VLAERDRQKDVEGWSEAHDDGHSGGELASAAACYALASTEPRGAKLWERVERAIRDCWPFDRRWFKLSNKRRYLVKAGALILAEIERLDRGGR